MHVTSDFLYPIVVAVSVITTFLTPYMIRFAEPASNFVDTHLPERWQELRSYLGIHEDRELRVLVSPQIPDFSVNLNEALALAYENSPDIQTMERRKLESESAVAKARANAGLKADIYLRFGLTQTADKLPDAYRNLLDQQYVSIGISLPILDWGRGKGQVRVARSNRDLVYTQVEQSRTDFELNVRKLVKP